MDIAIDIIYYNEPSKLKFVNFKNEFTTFLVIVTIVTTSFKGILLSIITFSYTISKTEKDLF